MTNIEIAWVFWEIADLLELRSDEDFYKTRAYRKAAKTLKHLPVDINDLFKQGKLEELPGVGKAIAENITELIETGECELLLQLRKEVPVNLRELLAIPGVGPKTIRLVNKELGIKTIQDLKEAAKHKKLRNLPGIGTKTELLILRGTEMLEQNNLDYIPIGIALPVAEIILDDLRGIPAIHEASICGSLRRAKEMVKKVDILVSTTNPELVKKTLENHPHVKELVTTGTKKVTVLTWLGIKINVYIAQPDMYWTSLNYLTGSKEYIKELEKYALDLGYAINEYELFNKKTGSKVTVNKEEEIYETLEMQYIPPELRDNKGEIKAAAEGKLPTLLEMDDIKGDLHMHTSWSDGICTIEEMAEAAIKKGYQYMAITDHSRSLAIAKGLSIERLNEQHSLIRKLNEKYDDFHILTGVEVDILQDNRLDYPDEILEQCDVVVASIHTGLRQEKEKIQARLETALKNPHVDIIAHPTGRILGRRKPYHLDFDQFFDLAKKENKILELNSSPDRLDLNGENVKKAVLEYNIPIAINTDAHDTSRLDHMNYGVLTARRGWLGRENVINTLEFEELKKVLRR